MQLQLLRFILLSVYNCAILLTTLYLFYWDWKEVRMLTSPPPRIRWWGLFFTGRGSPMSNLILVTGGARSGKSSFAELLALKTQLPVTYIATAQIWDAEMTKRIEKHRERRPRDWKLIEEPYDVSQVLQNISNAKDNNWTDNSVILLDCITLWLSNLLLRETALHQGWDKDSSLRDEIEAVIFRQVKELANLAGQISPHIIFVTNEVGQGIVPENPLSRLYRDLSGKANQILAEAAGEVYLVVAGYPIEIKQAGERLLKNLSVSGG